MQHNHIKYFIHYFISRNIKPKYAESGMIIASVLWRDHFCLKLLWCDMNLNSSWNNFARYNYHVSIDELFFLPYLPNDVIAVIYEYQ